MKLFMAFAIAILPAAAAGAQTVLTLDDAVRLAQAQGNAAKSAHQSLEGSRWRHQSFSAGFRPQLSLAGSAVNFNRSILPITGPTGETQYVGQAQNQSAVTVQVEQPIRQTGGSIFVSSGLNRIDLFGNRTGQSWQTTPLVVGVSQDLFRPNTLKWNERTEALQLTVAEREYVEAREDAASSAVAAFFDLLIADIDLRNALANVAVNDTIATINKVKYERGSINEGEVLQGDYALLRSRQTADVARLNKTQAEATLRRLLNLPETEAVSVVAPKLLGLTSVDADLAVKAALENGSLKDQSELAAVSARRQIEQARLDAGFSARVSANVGFNQTAPAFFDAYQSPLGTQRLSVGVTMPLLQGGAGKANVEAGRATLARAQTDASARRADLAEQARFAALGFMQSQSGLGIAAKADSVATRRFAVTKAQYDAGRSSLTELLLAQTDKDAALVSSAQALRGYWVAYYRLRRLTLYDFVGGRAIQ